MTPLGQTVTGRQAQETAQILREPKREQHLIDLNAALKEKCFDDRVKFTEVVKPSESSKKHAIPAFKTMMMAKAAGIVAIEQDCMPNRYVADEFGDIWLRRVDTNNTV